MMSVAPSTEKHDKKEITKIQEEELVDVKVSSYLRFIAYAHGNKVIFAICLLLFFVAEGINTAYFRILAEYDNLIAEQYETIPEDRYFWMTLGFLQLGFFIFLVLKYAMLNLATLRSNRAIH